MIFKDALQKYTAYLEAQGRARKTIYGYGSDLCAFQRFYERRHNIPWLVEETVTDDIEAFLLMLYETRALQAASRNRILHCLKSFFKYLHARGMSPIDPTYGVNSIRINRKERSHLTEDEYLVVVQALNKPTIRVATQTLWYTGLRIGELTHLSIDNVDLKQKVIHVVGKGSEKRDVPIHPKLMSFLEQYVEDYRADARPYERFFALDSTGGLSPSHFNREIHRATNNLGLGKKITAHIFRHSFASNLVYRGVHIVVIQKLLGHKSIDVTTVYTHANLQSVTAAVNLL